LTQHTGRYEREPEDWTGLDGGWLRGVSLSLSTQKKKKKKKKEEEEEKGVGGVYQWQFRGWGRRGAKSSSSSSRSAGVVVVERAARKSTIPTTVDDPRNRGRTHTAHREGGRRERERAR
jgi:hypothetical protein